MKNKYLINISSEYFHRRYYGWADLTVADRQHLYHSTMREIEAAVYGEAQLLFNIDNLITITPLTTAAPRFRIIRSLPAAFKKLKQGDKLKYQLILLIIVLLIAALSL